MKECSKYDLPCRLIRLITFIDLPIKMKFRLFSFGVLFWFLVMVVLTVVGMYGINLRYDKIVNHAVPQDKVVQKDLEQWYLKITEYSDALLEDLNLLDKWPKRVITMQKNWIGKSYGVEIFLN